MAIIKKAVMSLSYTDDTKKKDFKIISGSLFFIKDYQGGYRWNRDQIITLLNDLISYDNFCNGDYYFLQPLIVKECSVNEPKYCLDQIIEESESVKNNNTILYNNYYELIDGQQRLTTIFLILKYLSSIINLIKMPFNIFYESKRNIDSYCIRKAYETIAEWFNNHNDACMRINACMRIIHIIIYEILFIWYELDRTVDSSEQFASINKGKVPLTNAELFKSLLLNDDEFGCFISEDDYFEQRRIRHFLRKYFNCKNGVVKNSGSWENQVGF